MTQQTEARVRVADDAARELRFLKEDVTGRAANVLVAALRLVGDDFRVAVAALEDRRMIVGSCEGLVGPADVAIAAALDERVQPRGS